MVRVSAFKRPRGHHAPHAALLRVVANERQRLLVRSHRCSPFQYTMGPRTCAPFSRRRRCLEPPSCPKLPLETSGGGDGRPSLHQMEVMPAKCKDTNTTFDHRAHLPDVVPSHLRRVSRSCCTPPPMVSFIASAHRPCSSCRPTLRCRQ